MAEEIDIGTDVFFQKHGRSEHTTVIDRMWVECFDEYVYKHEGEDVYHGRDRYTKESNLTVDNI